MKAYRVINKILTLFTGRTVVRGSLARGAEYLRLICDDQEARRLPEPALEAVVQEAYRRAASMEKDGRARHGPYFAQLHSIADSLEAAAKRQPCSDARIRSILEFHKLA
jgi:hypothetical protein